MSILFVVGACQSGVNSDGELRPQEALSPVQQQVEGTRVELNSPKPGLDAHGHLLLASDLVAGFEVPMRAKLRKAHRQYLALDLQASEDQIHEFYSGLDRKTGRRFTDRSYAINTAEKTGDINIGHTRESLRRLRLGTKHEKSRVAIRKITHWKWEMRVYDVRRSDSLRPFYPNLDSRAPTASERSGLAGRVSGAASAARGSQHGGSKAKTSGRGEKTSPGSRRMGASNVANGRSSAGSTPSRPDVANEQRASDFANAWDKASVQAASAQRAVDNSQSTIGGIPTAPGQQTFQDHKKGRYGPYPPSGKKSVREQVRRWQLANPNKVFLD